MEEVNTDMWVYFFINLKKKEIRQKSHDFAISFTYNQI